MLARCRSTVLILSVRSSAIPLLVRPATTRRKTSNSRGGNRIETDLFFPGSVRQLRLQGTAEVSLERTGRIVPWHAPEPAVAVVLARYATQPRPAHCPTLRARLRARESAADSTSAESGRQLPRAKQRQR